MTRFTMLLALFWAPFVHENAAILAAAWMVTEHGVPWPLALLAVFAGIVVSDSAIYALGAAAHRMPGLRRLLIGPRTARMEVRLRNHLGTALMLSHVLPGILFPTFLACGWSGISYRRFCVMSIVAAAVSSTAMLFVMMMCSGLLLPRAGAWTWPVMALVMTGLSIKARLSSAAISDHFTGPVHKQARPLASHMGMPPPPDKFLPKTSLAEHIPAYLFYAPLAVRWLLLGIRHGNFLLPTVANPRIEMAGLWGESKAALFHQTAPEFRHWIAPFASVTRSSGDGLADGESEAALRAMHEVGLEFPVVTKPDCGWQGYGVRRTITPEALRAYLEAYPRGEKILLQKVIPWDGEAGVFYVRYPGEERGRIESMTFRYFPFVTGDGVSTVRQLIHRDERASFKQKLHLGRHAAHDGVGNELLERVPASGETVRLSFIGSIRTGGLYYDAQAYVTPELHACFDAICRSMPDFHFGRFDIRFKSVEQLQKAEEFAIIEINGAGSEAIHVWDPRKSLWDVYRDLFRFQTALFDISALNRARGCHPVGLQEFLKVTWHYRNLLRRYPPSE